MKVPCEEADVADWATLGQVWQTAVTEAFNSYLEGTTPIGAVVISDTGEIVSRGRSTALIERLKHAETEAIRQIPKTVDQPHYEIYTTLEPCPYCTGAIRMEKLNAVHFAARDPIAGSTHLLDSNPFMREFHCEVYPPSNSDLENAVVALLIEHRTRRGQDHWRDQWSSYNPRSVEVGELLASKGQHAQWVERGVNHPTLYDEVCSYFR